MAPAQRQHQRLLQFSKTKLCKFEVLGLCTKGNSCPFAHGQDEMKSLPDLHCTKLCAAMLQTGKCSKEKCTFAHSKAELRSTGAFHKTKLCRFESKSGGYCTLGARCTFAHTIDEVRPTDLHQDEAVESLEASSPAGSADFAWNLPFGVPPPAGLEPPPGLQGWCGFEASSTIGPAAAAAALGAAAGMPSGGGDEPATFEPAYVRLPGDIVASDQSDDDLWKATYTASEEPAHLLPPIRSVRTSESTLCTLGDHAGGWTSTTASNASSVLGVPLGDNASVTSGASTSSASSALAVSPERSSSTTTSRGGGGLSADAPVFLPFSARIPVKLPVVAPCV